MKMRKFLFRFNTDRRGVAVIEASVWMSLIGLPLIAGFDYALYVASKLRAHDALSQASISAFQSRDVVNKTQVANIAQGVWNNTTTPMTVTVTCNGSSNCVNTARTCGCISGFSAGIPTFTTAPSCTSTCSNGTIAGYFLTVRGQANYQAFLNTGKISTPTNIDQSLTVRLQ